MTLKLVGCTQVAIDLFLHQDLLQSGKSKNDSGSENAYDDSSGDLGLEYEISNRIM
jgi:hypothetical protein